VFVYLPSFPFLLSFFLSFLPSFLLSFFIFFFSEFTSIMREFTLTKKSLYEVE